MKFERCINVLTVVGKSALATTISLVMLHQTSNSAFAESGTCYIMGPPYQAIPMDSTDDDLILCTWYFLNSEILADPVFVPVPEVATIEEVEKVNVPPPPEAFVMPVSTPATDPNVPMMDPFMSASTPATDPNVPMMDPFMSASTPATDPNVPMMDPFMPPATVPATLVPEF